MAERNRFADPASGSSEGEPQIDESRMFASYGLIGGIVLFGAAGYLLDRWLGTGPWLLLAGLIAGVVVGFFGLISAVRH